MKHLVQTLIEWLDQLGARGHAAAALRALASETLKRVDSPDPEQRQFSALYLAQVADPHKQWDYDQAKQWLARADMRKFIESRQDSLYGHFRSRGHEEVVVPRKSETAGRHRAQWVLDRIPLDVAGHRDIEPEAVDPERSESATSNSGCLNSLTYEFTAASDLQIGLLGRILLGSKGSTPTRSARGLLWAGVMVSIACLLMLVLVFLWAMMGLQHPLTGGELASMVMLVIFALVIWRFWARPLMWLLEDRIIPAPMLLTAMTEDDCQLEMPKEQGVRYIRLVRYGGACPVCAGSIELRYGQGSQLRRLFGCCTESPQEHVFSFDRVTRRGKRIAAAG